MNAYVGQEVQIHAFVDSALCIADWFVGCLYRVMVRLSDVSEESIASTSGAV
jgi:hypothetical protein